MGEAITMTQQLYPGLLDNRPNLLFKLKCRQFVEMINGTDTELHNSLQMKSPPLHIATAASIAASQNSNKSSPVMSPRSHV